jgi:hypothetical protein
VKKAKRWPKRIKIKISLLQKRKEDLGKDLIYLTSMKKNYQKMRKKSPSAT